MRVERVRTVAPTVDPVFRSEVKRVLRLEGDAEDQLVEQMIGPAIDRVEEITERSLLAQTHRATFPCFADVMALPRATPLSSVTSVQYYDDAAALQTLSTDIYSVLTDPIVGGIARVDGESWPTLDRRPWPVEVTYVAGETTAVDLPASLRHAVVMLAAHFWRHPESVVVGTIASPIADTFRDLVAPFQVYETC